MRILWFEKETYNSRCPQFSKCKVQDNSAFLVKVPTNSLLIFHIIIILGAPGNGG
jgi:hypothetical protein